MGRRRGRRAEGVPQGGEVNGAPCLRGHVVQQRAHRFEGGEDFAADLVGGAHSIHRHQDSAVAVPREDGRGHIVVEGQPLGNDVCSVIGAMLERGSREQPADEFRIAGLQVQRHIRSHPQLAADQVNRAGLLHVPRDSVQHEPASGRLRGDQLLPHHVEHDLVGHELAAVERGLDSQAERGPPRHVIAQQLAGRDVRDVEVRGDQRALSPLARARGRDHQYPHRSSPHLIIPPSERPVDTSAHRRRQRVLKSRKAPPKITIPRCQGVLDRADARDRRYGE